MKTEKEILVRLEELKSEFLETQEYYILAAEKYKRGEYVWSKETDKGEVDHILHSCIKLHKEMDILEWVLDKKCPCGVSIMFDIELCPTCEDKLQLEMYEDQIDCEEKEAESLINMMKDDGLNYLYDGPL